MPWTNPELTSASAADAMEKQGLTNQAMEAPIKPVDPRMRVSGPAFPIVCGQDKSWAWAIINVLDQVPKGAILVINVLGDRKGAVMGDLMARAIKRLGIAGVVVDGAVRDPDGIRDVWLPVFARSVIPSARHDGPQGVAKTGVAVRCGGVTVEPGDWIIGDEMGVVVVPKAISQATAAQALNIIEAEKKAERLIDEGLSMAEVAARLVIDAAGGGETPESVRRGSRGP